VRAHSHVWLASYLNLFILICRIRMCIARLAQDEWLSMQKRVLVKITKDKTELSLREVLEKIQELQAQHPDEDVFFDGDEYAICVRPRKASP
jgi:hypothetical protein